MSRTKKRELYLKYRVSNENDHKFIINDIVRFYLKSSKLQQNYIMLK